MNLFRSEEHARRWPRYNPETEANLQPVGFWVDVFSGAMFRNRVRPDFLTWLGSDEGRASVAATVAKLPVTDWVA